MVTLGGDGLVYAGANDAPFALAAVAVKLVSTHGAGDEFIGVLAACIARGKPMREALEAANAAAAKLVATPEREPALTVTSLGRGARCRPYCAKRLGFSGHGRREGAGSGNRKPRDL